MQAPACAVALLDATGTTVVNFNATGQGIPPCHLQVLNSGAFAIEDSLNVIWTLNGKIAVPAANSGVMAVGQTLLMVSA